MIEDLNKTNRLLGEYKEKREAIKGQDILNKERSIP